MLAGNERFLTAGFLVLILLGMAEPGAQASAPPWVEALSRARLPEYGLETAAVCLLNETRTVVTDAGEIKSYQRTAYKILTRDGLALAWLRLSYDNEIKVSDVKAWNLKPGGVVHEAGQKDALETQLIGASGALFQDTKSLMLLIPQVEVGSIIAFEYERRHRPYILQDFWTLQQHYPVLRSRLELQLPNGWEFHHQILRHANSEPREIGKNNWVWELANLPAIPVEEGMPSLANLSALLVVTYYPTGEVRGRGETLRTWDDFASWTNRLIDPRLAISSEMSETARQLGTPKALAEFLQKKIRYVAVEIGIGGYQPHFAQETFRNQYGDCKDKVTLFRSLMKALNRDVYPVLINADRGTPVAEFPSPLYFNHMIAAIPLQEGEAFGSAIINHPEAGKLLLFDPTDERTPFGQLPSALQGTTAVLIRGDRGFLITMPVSNPAGNRALRTGNFFIAPRGVLSGEMSESYWGELAVRETEFLTARNQNQWVRGAERFLGINLPGAQVKKFGVSGLNQPPNPLREDYTIEAPNFVQAAGDLLLFRPGFLREPIPLEPLEESRNHPYQFSHVRSYRTSFNFQLPLGYAVDTLPKPQDLDLPFAQYRTEVTVQGDTLKYVSVYEIKKLEVSADQVTTLSDFYAFVRRASTGVVVLKRQN